MSDEGHTPPGLGQRRAAGVAQDFDGRRLSVARRLRCMARSELARQVGLTPAAVTQYERGYTRPTATVLARLSLVLGMPAEFFSRGLDIPEVAASSAHFRSLRATPAKRRDQALAFGELALAVLDIVERYVDLPAVNLPSVHLSEEPSDDEIGDAARLARHSFNVAPGPIPNVVRLLEAHGVLVLRLPATDFDPRVDAFSSSDTASGRPIVLMSPLKDDRARSRFDVSHELGHLLMHGGVEPGSKIVEAQAMSFAAEFLMPEAEIRDTLPTRVDWKIFHDLKRHWGVSLRALIFRAHKLGRLSDLSYRRANQQLQVWANPEPGPLGPPESPTVIGSAVTLLEAHGTRLADLAEAARIPLDYVEQVVAAGREDKPKLTLSI